MRIVDSPQAARAAGGVRTAVEAIATGDDERDVALRAAVVALIRSAVRAELVAAGIVPAPE